MIKKNLRFISKFYIFFYKNYQFIVIKMNIKILPPIEIGQKFRYEFSKSTRRYVLRKIQIILVK